MSRTTKDVKIIGKEPEEVEGFIRGWLKENGFEVWLDSSGGRPFHNRKWWQLIGQRVSPRKGSMVAVRLNLNGCIVFETSLTQESNNTDFHGEFYALGVDIFVGMERDLKPNPSIMGRLPRKNGYKLMVSLLGQLVSLSAS